MEDRRGFLYSIELRTLSNCMHGYTFTAVKSFISRPPISVDFKMHRNGQSLKLTYSVTLQFVIN